MSDCPHPTLSPQTRGCTPATSTTITVVCTREGSFKSQWSHQWFRPPCQPKHCQVRTKVTRNRAHKYTNTHHCCCSSYMSVCEPGRYRADVFWLSGFELSCVWLGEKALRRHLLFPSLSASFCVWSVTLRRAAEEEEMEKRGGQGGGDFYFWSSLFVSWEIFTCTVSLSNARPLKQHVLSHNLLQNHPLIAFHLLLKPPLSTVSPLWRYSTHLWCVWCVPPLFLFSWSSHSHSSVFWPT